MVQALARVPTPKESKPSKMDEAMHIPRPYKIRNFYTPAEVGAHNSAGDCWVSIFNNVYDLTLLLAKNHEKSECDPIIIAAGTDISHWFTQDPFFEVSPFRVKLHSLSSLNRSSTPKPAAKVSSALRVSSCTCLLRRPIPTGTPKISTNLGGPIQTVTALGS